MSSALKKILIITGLIALITSVVTTATDEAYPRHNNVGQVNPFIENASLTSSRHTQVEDMRQVDPDDIIEITSRDVPVLENDNYELFMNEDTLAFKVLDKASGYVWGTSVDNAREAGTYQSLLESGLGFEYIEVERNMTLRRNIGLTDTGFVYEMEVRDNDIILDIFIGGYCATRRCRINFPDYLEGRRDLDYMIGLGFTEISVELQLIVTLTDDGLQARVPIDSIVEHRDEYRLSSIIIFPGMGATYMEDIPGYMMIPDGVGALIRYTDKEGQYLTPYQQRFYGPNVGVGAISRTTNYPLSMPVFGAVHGVHQHAFLGIIESGAASTRLFAFPNGAQNVPFNLIFTKFDRHIVYTQSFQSDGTGGAPRLYQIGGEDYVVRYDFLRGQDADYVGMANHYQSVLRERGDLNRLLTDDENIPVHIQYLMADSRSQFIGTSLVEMTSVDDVFAMYDAFMDAGLTNQRVSLLGWNRGGYSGNLPSAVNFARSLRGDASFSDLIANINEANSVMLVNNYIRAGADANRILVRRDVAQAINRFRIEHTCSTCVYTRSYFLHPERSMQLAFDDYNDYIEADVGVLFEMLGSTLFSYRDREANPREQALPFYESIMQLYDGIGHYRYPNAYAYPYLTEFYDAPLFNSQLNYFDDLVPFLPITLQGHVNLFGSFLNFNSLGQSQILRLIDHGIYPSYVLTQARSSNLSGTDIERYFATQYDAWSDTIVEQYHFINDALRHTMGETVVAREVVETGVVKVTYSNDVEIIINYTNGDVVYDGDLVEALNYRVRGGQP